MSTFQRARRPEQIEARRTAILETARAMLAERSVADISLRELAGRVGLAKSNVLRYFDSREAIFLEVLDASWIEWLDDVERALGTPFDPAPGFAREERLAGVLVDSLLARRLLCELISAMASVLERNISLDFARTFKRRAAANTQRLADLVSAQIPELTPAGSAHFAGAVFVLVAGMWPYTNPTEAVATAAAEVGAPPAETMVRENVAEGLTNLLAGLVARRR